jgi:hypothetical protein
MGGNMYSKFTQHYTKRQNKGEHKIKVVNVTKFGKGL